MNALQRSQQSEQLSQIFPCGSDVTFGAERWMVQGRYAGQSVYTVQLLHPFLKKRRDVRASALGVKFNRNGIVLQ